MPRLLITSAARRLRGGSPSVPFFFDAALLLNGDDATNRTKNLVGMKYSRHDQSSWQRQSRFGCSTSPFMLKKREYHSTPRNEILPFIAVGLLGVTTIYTYRTLQQIDKDWDDYYDALEKYKAQTGIDPEKTANISSARTPSSSNTVDLSSHFTDGTLAIDLGTSTLKLSHRQSINNNTTKSRKKQVDPTICVDREGYRSTPSLVWLGRKEEGTIVGRLAQARSHDKKGGEIIRPRLAMSAKGVLAVKATREIIDTAASNALDQILGGGGGRGGRTRSGGLFVLDSSMATKGSYNARPIVTYPQHLGNNYDESRYLECYQDAMNELTSPVGIASFVAEPIATVAGAEHYLLLPPKGSGGESVLVIDVGGLSTSIALVSGDKEVLHSLSFPFGGDTFIDALVSHLIRNFDCFQHEESSHQDDRSPPSSKPTLSDSLALQRLYEASTSAVHELSNKTRSEINIPYLTIDLMTRQPKHLEVGMARTVVESEVESFIRKSLVPYLLENDEINILSQAFQTPSNLSSLFVSVIMSVLEQTNHTPYNLRAILLVGGGARIPLVRESLKAGVAVLAGDTYANDTETKRLIMTEGEMCDELNVLGAAVWGSKI